MRRIASGIRDCLPAAMACVLIIGCSKSDDKKASGDASSASTAANAQRDGDAGVIITNTVPDAATHLTESQIIGVVEAVHRVEIELGTLAQSKALATPISAYASKMVAAHTQADNRIAALGIAPLESDVAQGLRTSGATIRQELQEQSAGIAFDSAYVETQVLTHTMVLGLLDERLLKDATLPAVSAELTTLRGEVQAHLSEAAALREVGP